MKTYRHPLAGSSVEIHFPETEQELDGFVDWISEAPELLGFDTETTDLDIYSPGFKLRLAQFGDREQAWVIDVDRFAPAVQWALRSGHRWVVHNSAFDLKVVDHCLGVTLEEMSPVTVDTRILSHLNDPRAAGEGGAVGHSLKPLSQRYIDPNASDGQKELQVEFRRLKKNKSTGWAAIETDNETYVRYAGLDPILALRLHDALELELSAYPKLQHLSRFEHQLQFVLSKMERRGALIDVPYTEKLSGELQAEAGQYRQAARRYGVENVNATRQVSEALLAMGETLTERTPSGAVKVDKSVLASLADLDGDWNPRGTRTPNKLAEAILHAKRAEKWDEAYIGSFLNLRDGNDRLHASIGGLQARTGRMSISRPALQQLPSGEWRIRRSLIADPGQTIVACDYSQVEMRVLAALCGDPTLTEAIKSGRDLHDFTAEKVFGPGFTPKQRKISKGIGFGKVYGGGAATIQRQTGAPMQQVREALAAYDATFPGIKQYGYRLQEASGYGALPVETPAGRRLPLDRDRTYAATNYMVQSTARDLLAQALVDMDEAGLGNYLLLPVHDEVIAQAPAAQADEVVHEIARVMDGDFMGIPIVSDPEVYGNSWGAGYGAPTNEREAA